MKQLLQPIYCSRCGDEVTADELAMTQSTVCALCLHMQLEAEAIWRQSHRLSPIHFDGAMVGQPAANPLLPHPQS